jgi:Lysophospholipase
MLPGLARRFRVVTFDARGHGLSAKPAAGYGFDHVTADAAAVIKRPGCDGRSSWGTRGVPMSRSPSRRVTLVR